MGKKIKNNNKKYGGENNKDIENFLIKSDYDLFFCGKEDDDRIKRNFSKFQNLTIDGEEYELYKRKEEFKSK